VVGGVVDPGDWEFCAAGVLGCWVLVFWVFELPPHAAKPAVAPARASTRTIFRTVRPLPVISFLRSVISFFPTKSTLSLRRT
jgi:hypothetical protein